MFVVHEATARRRGFSLIELMVVIAIISILIGLLLPAIQKAREVANRVVCLNNMRQLGFATFLFKNSQGSFPRAGEHFVTYNNVLRKTQDLHSPLTLILPYLDQDKIYRQFDLHYRYNDPAMPQNGLAAQNSIQTYLCPSNILRGDRLGGSRDAANFGCTDYAPCPYTDIQPDGTEKGGDSFLMAAGMMGAPYPVYLYTDMAAGDGSVSPQKKLQLDTANGFIDPLWGGSNSSIVADGTSHSLAYVEDVGRTEKMSEASGGYLDPATGTHRMWWRWAEPETAIGISRRINNNSNPLWGPPACPWTNRDCGPNGEIFSFHPGGANALFLDGHAVFLRDSLATTVVRALVTRDGGESPDY